MIIFKKQLGFAPLITILIVVVLIIAGGAGYYFYLSRDEVLRDKTSQEQKEVEVVKPEQVIDETADLSPKALATEDWKIYENEKYKFKIKYPVDWWVAGETGAGREGVLHLFSVNIQKGKWGPPGELCMGCPGLFISIYNRDFFKGLGPVESSYWDSGMDVMMADYSAKKVLVKGENNVEEFFYILQDNNYDYKIEPSVPGIGGAGVNLEVEVNKVIPEFNQILSTFKFIEK